MLQLTFKNTFSTISPPIVIKESQNQELPKINAKSSYQKRRKMTLYHIKNDWRSSKTLKDN